ncbi:hypothetical protein [Enterobacter sp. CP102]|uniref:hypothetical protein n=1 Tax=Enterobacter sp. CP102 TaxID=2976431 RepID=UPI0022014AC5|nr:hypothetical protein [Enterobacter sp. CP102]UWM62293.1 hypothetical protein N1249_11845 [Enterobacter sp. CP102]
MNNRLKIAGLLSVFTISGCAITKQEAESMSPADSYYCSVDGGIHYAFGLLYKFDSNGYCRERTAELEKSGQMLDADKDRALRAGAGL